VEKKGDLSLYASTPVDSRMCPREDEPTRLAEGVAARRAGAGKGALTLPTLRPGVGLPPTSSSSVPPRVCHHRYRPSVRPCVLASTVRRSRHRFLTSPVVFFPLCPSADLCENLMKLKLREPETLCPGGSRNNLIRRWNYQLLATENYYPQFMEVNVLFEIKTEFPIILESVLAFEKKC